MVSSDQAQAQVSAPTPDMFVELRTQLQGELVLPSDSSYDEVRKIFNAMIDRRPAAIVQCSCTEDVVSAVNFAREHGLLVSVRGGGHGVSGHSVCDGGLMIDLSTMKGIEIDLDRKIATVQP